MPPILVAPLFPEVTTQLLKLLRSLKPDEWQLPTVSSRRTVKDIASHLLDGSLRRLSMQRDGYRPLDGNSQPRAGEPLMDSLNRLNDEWETGTRRLSPQVLIELTAWADAQLAELFQSLNPHAPAIFPVAWAGESQSENWTDVARDYTEKWHHTQQIFDATGRSSTIMNRRLGHPCFDTFMRALPFTFQSVEAATGSVVAVIVTGEAGGEWRLQQTENGWEQISARHHAPTTTVTMDQNTYWKLVTKRRSHDAIVQQFPYIQITGDNALGQTVLDMVSVMA